MSYTFFGLNFLNQFAAKLHNTVRGTAGDERLDGTAGNDTIFSGDGADTLYGGAGSDYLEGGWTDASNDEIYGGVGDDSVIGHGGDDTFFGGAGADFTFAGAGNDRSDAGWTDNANDQTWGGAGDDSLFDHGGNDTIYGGSGDDLMDAHSGDDVLYGDDGNDTMSGGLGDDTVYDQVGSNELFGGAGNDSVVAGGTSNVMTGGAGNDTLTALSGSITANGSEDIGNGDVDILDISALTFGGAEASAGDIVFGGGNNEAGSITHDGGTVNFSNIEQIDLGGSGPVPVADIVAAQVCFTRGTMIETADGQVAVEDLAEGMMVRTRDNGMQPIRWIGSNKTEDRAVRIHAGAMGNTNDLVVSPRHRMVLEGWQLEMLTDERVALVTAESLINDSTIVRDELRAVEYFHVMFDQHEVIFAEGAATESFHPDQPSMGAMDAAARAEIFALFPELEAGADRAEAAKTLSGVDAAFVKTILADLYQ